ncbi:TIM21-domain-containing protein [Tricharina praecox]|uniref:TIM21-domain-containing protein n=1 Tax=Tricharina praecox TaxID=43433 RepID=UPI002221023E|nr:TIM21-domain-containing protein [Tricharina praecox]KAI5845358.1 TIM21-domain-containing protein [Tricharina praecox]
MSLARTTARRTFLSSQLQSLRLFPSAPAYGIHSSAATRAAQQQQQQSSPKKQISLNRGDPSVKKWAELSRGQRAVRTASTGASAATILVGLAVTGAVFTFVYLEVIAPDSVTNWFNRAHARVKSDPQCVQLLGAGTIKAYGEETWNRWARNRPIAASVSTDRSGTEHLRVHFNVEGDLDKGVVNLHLIKRPGQKEYEYKYLYLDVAGRSRVYLENVDDTQRIGEGGKKKFLGVRWGW